MPSTSTNDNKHPYLQLSYWMNPSNHYWETDKYTTAAKEYYRNWLNNRINSEQSLVQFIETYKSRQ